MTNDNEDFVSDQRQVVWITIKNFTKRIVIYIKPLNQWLFTILPKSDNLDRIQRFGMIR